MNDFNLSEDTKAILLLCCPLIPQNPTRPLSLTEYNNLALVLYNRQMSPASLFKENNLEELASLAKLKDRNQLKNLFAMRGKLGFFIEEWQQSGIWILSRGDTTYPERLKSHLKDQRPPILFGMGDAAILQKTGLGIVGSRNVDKSGETFTREIAALCAQEKIAVVSGAARGVDSIAMLGCANLGGCAVGFLADNLLQKSLSLEFREHIASGRVVLLSPYHPKARFSVGSAMGRNKLIYGQAESTLVVSSDFQKGGTWAGAIEELKRPNHRPVFVREEADIPLGNKEIIKLGGIPFPKISDPRDFRLRLTDSSVCEEQKKDDSYERIQGELLPQPNGETKRDIPPNDAIYRTVLPILCEFLKVPSTSKELANYFDIGLNQMQKWLNRAIAENLIEKKQNRYQTTPMIKPN